MEKNMIYSKKAKRHCKNGALTGYHSLFFWGWIYYCQSEVTSAPAKTPCRGYVLVLEEKWFAAGPTMGSRRLWG